MMTVASLAAIGSLLRSPRPRRPRAALAASALCALALSACGQSEEPAAVLERAFNTPVKSADTSVSIEARLRGQAPQLQQPITLKLTGPYRQNAPNQLPSLDWRVSASGAGQTLAARLITVVDNAFIEFQGTAYEVGRDVVSQANRNRGRQQSLSAFGVDPKTWILDPQDRGEEDVAGVGTTHISGALDVGKVLRDSNKILRDPRARGQLGPGAAPSEIPEAQIAEIERSVKRPTFDVFVGEDDSKIRRAIANVDFTAPPAQQGSGVQGGTLKLTTELANVDGNQQVRPPANVRPLAELLQQFGISPEALGGARRGRN
jgi:hypothetical protein